MAFIVRVSCSSNGWKESTGPAIVVRVVAGGAGVPTRVDTAGDDVLDLPGPVVIARVVADREPPEREVDALGLQNESVGSAPHGDGAKVVVVSNGVVVLASDDLI